MFDDDEVVDEELRFRGPAIQVATTDTGPSGPGKLILLIAASIDGIQVQYLLTPEVALALSEELQAQGTRAQSKLEVATIVPKIEKLLERS